MKTLKLFLFLLLMPLIASAASPTFNSFLPTWFTNNGIVIGLNTNMVLTWQMVSTNSFNTNGNNLSINTNTFPTLAVVHDIVNTTSNQLSTNNWTPLLTNIYRLEGKVMVGTTNHNQNAKFVVDSSGHTTSALFTNRVSGTFVSIITESNPTNGASFVLARSTGVGNAALAAHGANYSYLELQTRSNATANVTSLLVNGDNRTYYDIGGRIAFAISNGAPSRALWIRGDGTVEIGFNTVHSNSLWTASSDTTNFVLNPVLGERTINMTANVRVVGVSALAPAGFRGFVGVTVTNNSGSTFTVETTNTFRPLGTNSFSVPSGKDARIVFQIDENRVFYGGTVTP